MEEDDQVRIIVMTKELAFQRELDYRRKVEMFSKQFYDDSMRNPMPLEVPSSARQNQNIKSNTAMDFNPKITSILAPPLEMKRSIPSYQLPISTSQNQKIKSDLTLHSNPATISMVAASDEMKHFIASYQLPISTIQNQNVKSNNAMYFNPATSSLGAPSDHLPLAIPSLWGKKRKRNTNRNLNNLSDSYVTPCHEMMLSNPSNQLGLSALSLSGYKRKEPEGVIFCEVCQVPCSSTFNYKQHLEGQKHKAKLQLLEMKRENGGQSSRTNLRCELCEIWCTCEDALKLHLKGQKHLMRLYQTGAATKGMKWSVMKQAF